MKNKIQLDLYCKIKINAYLCTIINNLIDRETHVKLYKIMATISKYQIRWAIISIDQKKVYKYQVEALKKIGFFVCTNYPASGWYACKHYRNSENLYRDIDSIKKAAVICKSNVGAIDYTDAQYSLCNNAVRPMSNATTLQIEKFSNIIK